MNRVRWIDDFKFITTSLCVLIVDEKTKWLIVVDTVRQFQIDSRHLGKGSCMR